MCYSGETQGAEVGQTAHRLVAVHEAGLQPVQPRQRYQAVIANLARSFRQRATLSAVVPTARLGEILNSQGVAGILPAFRAVSIRPVEAIRTE